MKQSAGWAFIAPGIVLLIGVMGFPIAALVSNSLHIYDFANPTIPREFIGIRNYITLLTDARFLKTMGNTFVFTVSAVSLQVVLGMVVALLINRVFAGRRLIIGLFVLPTAAMPVAVGLIWRYMYNNEYGIFSYFLKQVGLLGSEGLLERALRSDPYTAMASIILTDVWEWTPFMALVLLGGLLSLPREPFEAATVDGATSWKTFWRITLPLLRPVLAIGVLIRLSDAAKVLDIVYVLTGGGPGDATETAHLFAYRLNFKAFRMGYGSAQVMLLSLVVLVISAILFRQIAGRLDQR
jgi:multiple sugar transport system permease protein